MLICLMLLLSLLGAVDKTVCASGCDYSDFQLALDATVSDCSIDSLTLTTGENFDGHFVIPYRPCVSRVWVRSSSYKSLPADGYRFSPPSHTGYVATLRPGADVNKPIVRFGNDDSTVMTFDALDLGTDTITLSSAASVSVGTAVGCGPGRSTGTYVGFPGGLTPYSKFWIASKSSNDVQLSYTFGGPVIDITSSSGMGGTFYEKPRCTLWNNTKGWKFDGIEITTKDATQLASLVDIGGAEVAAGALVRDVVFTHMYIHNPYPTGSTFGVSINTAGFTIKDSYLEGFRRDVTETKCFALVTNPGPTVIQNTYCDAASINLLTGGATSGIGVPVTNLKIVGNHFEKRPDLNHCASHAGGGNCGVSGAPSGACYYANGRGSYYRDSSVAVANCTGGGCYRCQSDSTWIQDTTLNFAQLTESYLTKGIIELKNCTNCRIEGNLLEGTYDGGDSNVSCLSTIQTDQGLYTVNRSNNVWVGNNWCKSVLRGMAFTSGDTALWAINVGQIWTNNIITGFLMPQLGNVGQVLSDVVPPAIRFYAGMETEEISNTTVRGTPWYPYTLERNAAGDPQTSNGVLANNILAAGSTYNSNCLGVAGGCNNCTDIGAVIGTTGSPIPTHNNVMFGLADWSAGAAACQTPTSYQVDDTAVGFVGADPTVLNNNRLSNTSPYSAENGSATMLSANGTSGGTDVDYVEQRVTPAQAGEPNWGEQLRVRVVRTAGQAIVTSSRAIGASDSTLVVYDHARRLVGDEVFNNTNTSAAPSWTVGSLTPGNTYWYKVASGGMYWVGSFVSK